eukprot:SAG22_NODE_16492_length_324_cov_0.724444_2_plen_35_part_01
MLLEKSALQQTNQKYRRLYGPDVMKTRGYVPENTA